MSAIILQSRAPGAPWGTLNRFVAENAALNSVPADRMAAARAAMRERLLDAARTYAVDMLPGREFRVIEIATLHAVAPAT